MSLKKVTILFDVNNIFFNFASFLKDVTMIINNTYILLSGIIILLASVGGSEMCA